MNNTDQLLIQKVCQAMDAGRRRKGIASARQKTETELVRAQMTLLVDTMTQEGVNVSTPRGMAILLKVIEMKALANKLQQDSGPEDLEDGFQAWSRKR
jgi:hypothetical protein